MRPRTPVEIRDEDSEVVETNKNGSQRVLVSSTGTLRGRAKPFHVIHCLRAGSGIQREMLDGNFAIATSMSDISAHYLCELHNRRGDTARTGSMNAAPTLPASR